MDNDHTEFSILVFQTAQDCGQFVAGSAPYEVDGIEVRPLSPNILLVTRNNVAEEDWSRFHGMGYNSIYGRFSKMWHETHDLMRETLCDLRASQTPHIELYSGNDCRIITPATD